MGFYLRKGVRVGPLRFNLSKSGIGVSAGIRGLRFGTGPRGNYVHMGRHGLYYRATLPSAAGRPSRSASPVQAPVPQSEQEAPGGGLREIESADVSQMRDASSKELLDEIAAKRAKTRLAPIVGVLGATAVVALFFTDAPRWVPWLSLVGAALGTAYAHLRDELTKSVVLFYELERDSERDYQRLHDAFGTLHSCARAWHVEAEGDVLDRKRSAGATSVVRKRSISLSRTPPPFVKTNLQIPAVPAGRQTLYFFPDRILIFEPSAVGAIIYSDLQVERSPTRFIEDGALPPDATVVDRTWRYVNKKGGPDRRFANNRELPVALYEDLHLRSASGLNELFQFSKVDAAEEFEAALRNLAEHGPTNTLASTGQGAEPQCR